MGHLFCVALVVFSTLTVSRAEKPLFVRTEDAVRLDVQGYEGLKLDSITWLVNTTNILRYIITGDIATKFGIYSNRVEFEKRNFSLLLKNVQQNDSGIYAARITDNLGNEKVAATYRLTVQEPVPKPQMTVALLSSPGRFCRVSVNCSAVDTRASYTCNHTHCTQVQVMNTTSPTGVSLIVTAANGTIQCTSSNFVSTAMKTKSIEKICQPEKKTVPDPDGIIHIAVPVSIAVLIVIVVIIIIIIIIRKRKRRSEGTQVVTQANTDYATVEAVGLQNLSTVETMYDAVTPAKPERLPEVNTVYDTVGPPGDNSAKPESVYATVNKSTA